MKNTAIKKRTLILLCLNILLIFLPSFISFLPFLNFIPLSYLFLKIIPLFPISSIPLTFSLHLPFPYLLTFPHFLPSCSSFLPFHPSNLFPLPLLPIFPYLIFLSSFFFLLFPIQSILLNFFLQLSLSFPSYVPLSYLLLTFTYLISLPTLFSFPPLSHQFHPSNLFPFLSNLSSLTLPSPYFLIFPYPTSCRVSGFSGFLLQSKRP